MPGRGEQLFVGLISGTSVDGVDAALIGLRGGRIRLLAARGHPIPSALRAQLLALTTAPHIALGDYGSLDNAVADLFADAALSLLSAHGVAPGRVRAIGSHGQNLWHDPERGISLQIGNPARIAARTGITTVADFRRRDLAHGGQGAPLAPAFHRALFAAHHAPLCVLNIGGIANLTRIDDGPLTGFDTGPGNALMDAWCQRHEGNAFDAGGRWAAGGTADPALLETLLNDPYFAKPPPKSTGREHFNLHWLEAHLTGHDAISPRDVQRTLLELTVQSAARAIKEHGGTAQRVAVCGGGAHNEVLMRRLARHVDAELCTTDDLGFPADWIEAGAFAWYAALALDGRTPEARSVTGAERDAILGGIYPA